MSSRRPAAAVPAGSAQATLRRLILYALLAAVVVIAATGLGGLLERLFSTGAVLASADVSGLARSLAFTVIGGPLAALLWWVVWRRLDDAAERASAAWGLYLAALYALSLIISLTSLLGLIAAFVGGQEPPWSTSVSTSLVWAAVWTWHRWMWRHPLKGPATLAGVPAVVGWVFGLMVGAAAAINALGILFDAAIRGFVSLTPVGEAWWQPLLRALVWAVGGGIVWWWHWFRSGGRHRSAFGDVALIAAGILVPVITALVGAGVAVFVLLRMAFDRGDPPGELLAPLGPSVAALAVGAVVWRFHGVQASLRSVATRQASLLVTSGVALAGAASGLGVVINAALAIAVSPLAGGGERALLLGGISSLLVGGPAWWQSWKPNRQPSSAAAIPAGRRVYLIVFFGLSAVVALIALLVIGFRLFEFLLGDVSQGTLPDRVRAPFGLLVAAGCVSAYHFGLWRRERAVQPAAVPAAGAVGQVTLVTSAYPETLAKAITDATGARVTVWKRADAGHEQPTAAGGPDGEAELVRGVVTALAGVSAANVLLVIGSGPRIDVIPLDTTAKGP